MLEPGERTLLNTVLEPPDGYRLDFAIGTTFSLDLLALLTAPLAFTRFDRGMEEEGDRAQSLELLESLRRYAGRIALFCHAGRIALPRARYPQFAWLERSVIECRPPSGGVFHPKVWVLRYKDADANVRYRALCLSRNLTHASSWDTLFAVDGEVRPAGVLNVDPQPLADFVAALPGLALREVDGSVASRIAEMARELRRVEFVPPAGFTSLTFHPLGIRAHNDWPFTIGGDRVLVISPFLSLPTLERLGGGNASSTLVSTPDALGQLQRRPAGFESFWTLDDDAIAELPPGVDEASESPEESVQLSGLHAKTYVIERGREAHVWTGSANATEGAFHRNVEFLVHLAGPRDRFGIDAVMTPARDSLRFASVLKDAHDLVARTEVDDVQRGLEARLEETRAWLANRCLIADVTGHGDRYDVVLRGTEEPRRALPDGVNVTCWPVMVGDARACRIQPGEPLARFDMLSLEGLSAFFAFRVMACDRDREAEARFVLNVPLRGAPADREEHLLRALIGDRARLIRFLTLLLSEDGAALPPHVIDPPKVVNGGRLPQEQAGAAARGMFEMLVRALDRAPERLDDIAKLLADLESRNGSERLFPERFDAIWRPIWEARLRMVRCETT